MLKTIFKKSLMIILLYIFCLCLHEFGHIIFGKIAGGEIKRIGIACVVFRPKLRLEIKKPFFGYVGITFPISDEKKKGLFMLGGSMTTFFISIASALCLLLFNLKGNTKFLLLLFSLYFFDILFYTFVAQVGLEHLLPWWREPEPLLGIIKLGIRKLLFNLFVIVFSLFDIVVVIIKIKNSSFKELLGINN